MTTTRRDFIRISAAAGAAVGLGLGTPAPAPARSAQTAPRALRILILGGTGFIGPHQVEAARARGHTVTLFNRGLTNPHMFPEVEKLRGDRDGDLDALRGREWDAVIDNSATLPRRVRETAGLLRDSVGRYVFISSSSVYDPFPDPPVTEDDPLATTDDPTTEVVNGQTFGPLKALSEREAVDVFGDRALIVRPVLIAGPHDYTDRYTYWPMRVARGGEVLAPGDGADPFQIVDARDLAEWLVHMVEQDEGGAYNTAGPAKPVTMREMLEEIRDLGPEGTRFTWVDSEFLLERGARPWSHMTAWIPRTAAMAGMLRVDGSRAAAKGLKNRPVAVTARDIVEWQRSPRHRSGPAATPYERQPTPQAGMPPEMEEELLRAWHGRSG